MTDSKKDTKRGVLETSRARKLGKTKDTGADADEAEAKADEQTEG